MTVGELFVMLGLQVNQEQWSKGMTVINRLKGAATGLISALGVRSVVSLVEHTTEAATHLVSLSRAMGMSIEQTQEWGYVAAQSGSNLKELSVGMNMFLRNLRLFSEGRGSKVLRDRFREIGLTGADARDALASHEGLQRVLFKTSDALQRIGPNGRQATFTQLFGVRAGRAMLADLERGSEGLTELMERRRAMGEITEDDALGLRSLGNRIKDVHLALSALGAKAVAELAPRLAELAEGAVTWIIANRELLTGALEVAIRGVAAAFQAVGAVVSTVSDLIHAAMGGDTGAQALLIGIAAAISTVLVPALWSMAAPILAATWPLLAIAAAAALVAYGLLQLKAHANEIGQAIQEVAVAVRDFVAKTVGDLVDTFEELGRDIEEVGETIIQAFVDAWEAVKQGASDAFDWIADKARHLPIISWLIDQAEDGAARLANGVSGTSDFGKPAEGAGNVPGTVGEAPAPASVANQVAAPGELYTAPSPAAQALQAAALRTAGQAPNVSIGPTTVQISVNSVEEAKQAHDAFQEDRQDNALRHAMRGVAGEVP